MSNNLKKIFYKCKIIITLLYNYKITNISKIQNFNEKMQAIPF